MVGSTSLNGTDLDAVLKLKFGAENPTMYSGVVSGSLESTAPRNDPAYFNPIFIFDFPTAVSEYNHSLVPKGEPPSRIDESLSLDSAVFCSVLEKGLGFLELEYAAECAERRLPHRCSPISLDEELSPSHLSLEIIQCDRRAKRAKFLARFSNPSEFGGFVSFPLNSTAIGGAWWDDGSNRIIGTACPILDPSLNLGNYVADCTIRLSMRVPSVLTMRNDAKIVGEIWSSKGYFSPIGIASSEDAFSVGANHTGRQSYEYREVDRVRDSCREKKAGKKGKKYPDGKSDRAMRFDMYIRKVVGDYYLGAAYMVPVPAENDSYPALELPLFHRKLNAGELKMRYKITICLKYPSSSSASSSSNNNDISERTLDWAAIGFGTVVEMNGEGVYDSESGQLCMVACRKLALNSVATFQDCDVAVEVEVPPWNERRHIKGIIGSTRPPTDALYFDDLIIESQY